MIAFSSRPNEDESLRETTRVAQNQRVKLSLALIEILNKFKVEESAQESMRVLES